MKLNVIKPTSSYLTISINGIIYTVMILFVDIQDTIFFSVICWVSIYVLSPKFTPTADLVMMVLRDV